MKLLLKKTLIALTVASLGCSVAQAQAPANVKEIRNELGIMLNILQASLKQNTNKGLRFRADEVTYLLNQGVVFNIDSNNRGNFLSIDLSNLSNMISGLNNMPVAPVAPNNSSYNFSFAISGDDIDGDELEDSIRDAMELERHFVEESRDKMRELSERQRDIAWEQREYERSRRDLEFEKRNAEGERRKAIDKELAELAGELKKLESKRSELEKYSKELAEEHSKLAAERDAAKKQLYSQSLAVFEDTVGDMLCRYGAGLKSLPDNENISFVLSNFSDAERDSVIRSHDKVYVFKNKDVKSCVSGKSNKEQLLAAASTYLF